MSATVLAPGTVISANGATGPLTVEADTGSLLVTITATAKSGTPSVVFTAQRAALRSVAQVGGGTGHLADADYPPGGYDTGVASAAITGTGEISIVLPPLLGDDGSSGTHWRLAWAITGGGSLTVGVEAEG